MTSYTYLLKDNEIEILKNHYSNFIVDSNNQYALFEIRLDCVITVFKTRKVLLMGLDVSNRVQEINQLLGICDYEAIGCAEIGGDNCFGPIIFCSVYTSLEAISLLTRLGIKNDAKFSDTDVISIVPKFKDYVSYSVVALDNRKYNEYLNKGHNINKVRTLLMTNVINSSVAKSNKSDICVYVDKYVSEEEFKDLVNMDKLMSKNINYTEDTNHICVIAAKLLARYAYLRKYNELCSEIGFKVNLGTSSKVDDDLKKLISLKGVNYLKNCCKLNFKNVKDVM